MNGKDERAAAGASMHEGTETWDHVCGCGVPHWGEPTEPESSDKGLAERDGKS